MDRHAIYGRQRVDVFAENEVACTESARQHKDATDLVMQSYQETVGTLVRSDHKGISNQYVSDERPFPAVTAASCLNDWAAES